MADSCATCFFQRLDRSGQARCHRSAPTAGDQLDTIYPRIPSPPWCGEFSVSDPGVYPGFPTGVLGSGTFAWPAAANAVITDARVTASCFIVLRPLDAGGAAMMGAANECPFELSRVAGVSITLTTSGGWQNPANFGYALLAP
jgi:hypothetical protein